MSSLRSAPTSSPAGRTPTLGDAVPDAAGVLAQPPQRAGAGRILLLAAAVLLGTGCSARTTGPTEVGVRTHRLLGPGIEPHVYPPGGTYLFAPGLADWATFDIALQNLAMTGAEPGEPAVEFKTLDGNDIRVSVTVSWRIEPKMAPQLLELIGPSTQSVRERLVRPVCRSIVRDILNELRAEEYYRAELRFAKAEKARARLAAELQPEGILIEQVLLGTHHFNPGYEEVLRQRKLAEQSRDRLRSETAAAQAAQLRDLEHASGTARITVTQARGEAAQQLIAADRQLYEHEREARALFAEKSAAATALSRQRQALSGRGGRSALKLRVADSLRDTPILVVPKLDGAAVQRVDLNRLLQSANGTKQN